MSPIFMPGRFSERAQFYYQLAQLTSAGITIPAAFRQLHYSPPARSYRVPIERILLQIERGLGLTDSLRSLDWLPEFDLSMIEAGEQSGRLDVSFASLAEYYSDRAQASRQFLADLAYPALLLHLAVLIFPFPAFFLAGDWRMFLKQTLGILGPIYGLVALLLFAGQASHGESWRAIVERILRRIPVLGQARRDLALSRLSLALEGLLSAGVSIITAWEGAAAAGGSPALRRAIQSWRPQIEAGVTPAELVRSAGLFPHLFVSEYAAGEISGRLDEVLKHLHRFYREDGQRKMRAINQWIPRFIYFVIVIAIATRIVSFYSNYFDQIGKAINGF